MGTGFANPDQHAIADRRVVYSIDLHFTPDTTCPGAGHSIPPLFQSRHRQTRERLVGVITVEPPGVHEFAYGGIEIVAGLDGQLPGTLYQG